ncbi:hypothetical protein DLM77_04635 [Leptospira yasudae]|uniref:histidine kinase n=1 Tax=Leptospira yasudae TaxID=2202201 RepID=A0ABX9M6A0_9LEPT|nr:hypothetical protein DLM77_04635 [Leptospira yasudae]
MEKDIRRKSHLNPKTPTITGNVFSPESSEILDHLPLLICKFLPDTTLTYINQTCCDVFGKNKQQLYAVQWIHFLPENFRNPIFEILKNVRNTLHPETHSYDIRNSSGERLHLEWKIYPVLDKQNQFQGFLGVGADKTKEAQVENEIKQKNELIRNVVGTIDDLIWSSDAKEYKLLYISEGAKKLYGIEPEEFFKDDQLWINLIHPDDRYLAELKLKELRSGKPFYEVEYRIKRPDGQIRYISDRSWIVRDANGQPERIEGIARDVTDRIAISAKLEKSEENLRALIENTQDSIWSVDRNYRIITMNRIFHEAIFSIYKINLKIGSNILEEFDSNMSKIWKDIYDQTFEGNSIKREWEISNEDGTCNYYEIITCPIHGLSENKRTISGATIYIRDITERKNYENKTTKIIKGKDRLLAAVAHDLKNPISGIISLTELLKEQTNNPNNAELLGMMSQAANKTLNIIQDLLQIAEMENENYKLKTEKANLNHLIQTLVKQNLPDAENKKIKLHAKMGTDPIPVQIELLKFQRVLENLISNSLKFTKEGGEILIHSYSQDKKAMIIVEDTGIGIPLGLQSAIFDQFTRAKRQGLKGEQTTGLGMSIVKVIVELHKGKISLESEEGIGTKFIIEIPLDN